MMENMTVQRVAPLKYWPHDRNIPVLSEASIVKLKEAKVVEIDKDPWKEDILKLITERIYWRIPKMLTSRAALLFMGFTEDQAEKLWHILLKVSSPSVIPSVENGGQWAFWMELKLWLWDAIHEAPRVIRRDQEEFWTNRLLDRIGLAQPARVQELKVISNGKTVITDLQSQKPQDVLYLAKKYIDHRWQMLEKMESIIAHSDGSDWWPKVRGELSKSPMTFQTVYTLDGDEWLSDLSSFLPTKSSSGQAQW